MGLKLLLYHSEKINELSNKAVDAMENSGITQEDIDRLCA